MQVLIKIDEARFKDIQRIAEVQLDRRTDTVEQLIANGTPLPKGHGRLIDADDIDNHIIGHVDTRGCPTIIEADKAESGEKE